MSAKSKWFDAAATTTELDDEALIVSWNDYYCPVCNAKMFCRSGEDSVPTCKDCGFVNSYFLDSSPEWKSGKEDTSSSGPSSAGATTVGSAANTSSFLYSFASSAKEIKIRGSYSLGASSSTGGAGKKRKRADTSAAFKPSINDRTFFEHCQHIMQVCLDHRMQRVILERSVWWYKELLQFYKFHGFVCDALKAAGVYMASYEYKFPITQKECADMFGVRKTYATKCINLMEEHRNSILNDVHGKKCVHRESIQRSRQLQLPSLRVPNSMQDCTRPSDFLRLFLSRLGNPFTTDQLVLCFFVADKVEKRQLAADNYSYCVAATIIFLVGESFLSKKRVCEISNTSEVTLNRCYNKLAGYRQQLLPNTTTFTTRPLK